MAPAAALAVQASPPLSFGHVYGGLEETALSDEKLTSAFKLLEAALRSLLGYWKPAPAGALSAASPTDDEKAIASRLSRQANLDPAQAADLLRTFKADCGIAQALSADDDAFAARLLDFYYEERLALMQCVSAVLRIVADESHPYRERAEKSVQAEAGLGGSLLQQARQRVQAAALPAPAGVEPEPFIRACVHEATASLEALFLYYYTYPSACTAQAALELLTALAGLRFGSGLEESTSEELDAASRAAAARFAPLACITAVEAMSLEAAAGANHPLLSDEPGVALLDQAVRGWSCDSPGEAAATLAWASLLLAADQAGAPGASRLEPRPLFMRAFAADAIGALSAALSSLVQFATLYRDSSLFAYRSVLKGLLEALLSGFDVGDMVKAQPDAAPLHVSRMIELAIAVFEGAPSLCEQFWEEGRRGRGTVQLLEYAASRFPAQWEPMLALCAALSGAPERDPFDEGEESGAEAPGSPLAARGVLEFLSVLPTYTAALPAGTAGVQENSLGGLLVVAPDGLVDPATGARLRAGTAGRLAVVGASDARLAQWDMPYSAWALLAHAADAGAASAALAPAFALLAALLRSDPSIAPALDAALCTPEEAAAGSVARRGAAGRALAALRARPEARPLAEHCACVLAAAARGGATVAIDAPLARAVVRGDAAAGAYGATGALLAAAAAGLARGGAEAVVEVVATEVLPGVATLPFAAPVHRWRLAAACLALCDRALLRPASEAALRAGLLREGTPALLSALSAAFAGLRLAHAAPRQVPDAVVGALLSCVEAALALLASLLGPLPPGSPPPPLAAALLADAGGAGPGPLLSSIASHAHLPRTPRVGCLTLRTLAALARLAPGGARAPPSLLALLADQAAGLRQAVAAHLTSPEPDSLSLAAALELLADATQFQPELADFLYNAPREPMATGDDKKDDDRAADEPGCAAALSPLLARSASLSPAIRLRLLAAIRALWAAAAEQAPAAAHLRAAAPFWPALAACALGGPEAAGGAEGSSAAAGAAADAAARACALQIVTAELLPRGPGRPAPPPALVSAAVEPLLRESAGERAVLPATRRALRLVPPASTAAALAGLQAAAKAAGVPLAAVASAGRLVPPPPPAPAPPYDPSRAQAAGGDVLREAAERANAACGLAEARATLAAQWSLFLAALAAKPSLSASDAKASTSSAPLLGPAAGDALSCALLAPLGEGPLWAPATGPALAAAASAALEVIRRSSGPAPAALLRALERALFAAAEAAHSHPAPSPAPPPELRAIRTPLLAAAVLTARAGPGGSAPPPPASDLAAAARGLLDAVCACVHPSGDSVERDVRLVALVAARALCGRRWGVPADPLLRPALLPAALARLVAFRPADSDAAAEAEAESACGLLLSAPPALHASLAARGAPDALLRLLSALSGGQAPGTPPAAYAHGRRTAAHRLWCSALEALPCFAQPPDAAAAWLRETAPSLFAPLAAEADSGAGLTLASLRAADAAAALCAALAGAGGEAAAPGLAARCSAALQGALQSLARAGLQSAAAGGLPRTAPPAADERAGGERDHASRARAAAFRTAASALRHLLHACPEAADGCPALAALPFSPETRPLGAGRPGQAPLGLLLAVTGMAATALAQAQQHKAMPPPPSPAPSASSALEDEAADAARLALEMGTGLLVAHVTAYGRVLPAPAASLPLGDESLAAPVASVGGGAATTAAAREWRTWVAGEVLPLAQRAGQLLAAAAGADAGRCARALESRALALLPAAFAA